MERFLDMYALTLMPFQAGGKQQSTAVVKFVFLVVVRMEMDSVFILHRGVAQALKSNAALYLSNLMGVVCGVSLASRTHFGLSAGNVY